jgi:hypothetical protein
VRVRPIVAVVCVMALGPALVACSNDDTGAGAFCSALRERMSVIATQVADAAGIDALVETYEELDERAPLAIEEPWGALTDLVRTAATVAPDDADSVQALADAAYAAERSARAVATWVAQTCGFAMPAMEGMEGPVDPPPTKGSKSDKSKRSKRTTTIAP